MPVMFDLDRAVKKSNPQEALFTVLALVESAERVGWDVAEWPEVYRGLMAFVALTGIGKSEAVVKLGESMVRLRDFGTFDPTQEDADANGA